MAVAIRGYKKLKKRNPDAPVRFCVSAPHVYTATVDERGRLTLPAKERAALDLLPGTVFRITRDENVLLLAKAENPFDGLALHAIAERKAGRTRNLRAFAEEEGIPLDAG